MRFLSCCLASLWFCTLAIGQGANDQVKKEEEQRVALRRKAYVLVEEVANGALSLKLPENRSATIVSAGDLLWEHDQKRARALFWDGMNTLNLLYQSTNSGKTTTDTEKVRQEYLSQAGLRSDLLRRISKRDPQLALDILRATQQVIPDVVKRDVYMPSDREIEQEIAAAAAARDPQRTLELARESMAKGFTFQLLQLLYQINQRDQELGSKFAAEMIAKLQTSNLDKDHFGARIGVDLVLMSRQGPTPDAADYPWTLKLEREQRRELVQIIANAALSVSPNPNLLYGVDEILPELEEFAPERIAMLRTKLAAFEQTLNKDQRGWSKHNALVRSGTPEEMLRASLSLADEQRNSLQNQAIRSAVNARRADSLRDVITNEISDEDRRKALLDSLQREEINWAIYDAKPDKLREMLPQIKLREERARAMSELAILLEKKGQHDEAVKLLDEARTMIKLDFESETQSNALLSLIAAYAEVEPSKAFAIIEKAADRANDQLAKLLLLDKIIKSGFIKKGELVMTRAGNYIPEYFLFRYGKGVVALAKADFDRTKAAADRFSRNELRLTMRLMLARAILNDTAKSVSNQKQP